MRKVQILMSTYNGEKFLKEQLDSILEQSYQEFQILIRDDGSSDGTIEILKEYEKKENIKIILGVNIGVVKSFFELMNQDGDYDYYVLSDQDDYWDKDKLKIMIESIENIGKEVPILCVSNYEIVSSNLSFIKKGYDNNKKIELSIKNSLVENPFPGCVYFYNNNLKQIFKNKKINYEKIIMHDYFLYMLATIVGEVKYIPKCLIKYRQHENNVIGNNVRNNFFKNLYLSLKNTKKIEGIKSQVELILNTFKNKIETKKIENMKSFLETKTIFDRMLFLLKYGLEKNSKNLYMKIRYILKKY